MRACGLALIVLFAASGVQAQPASLAAAQQAAASGDYLSAVRDYDQVLDRDGFSAPVLFNLGNAWLRLGKPARAILEYERARVLAPHSAPLEANLAAAQQRAGLTPEAVGPWLALARHFSLDTYLWASFGAIWVLCIALVMLSLRGGARRIARPVILVAAITLCVSADAAALCWPDLSRAVAQEPVSLHLAPALDAAASGTVRAGEVVWVQDHYGDFNFVRTADGRTGWVSVSAALPVRAARP